MGVLDRAGAGKASKTRWHVSQVPGGGNPTPETADLVGRAPCFPMPDLDTAAWASLGPTLAEGGRRGS